MKLSRTDIPPWAFETPVSGRLDMLARLPTLMMGNDGLWTDDGAWFISRARFAQPPPEDSPRCLYFRWKGVAIRDRWFESSRYPTTFWISIRARRFVVPFVCARKFWQTNVCHEPRKINDVNVQMNVERACRSIVHFRMNVRWTGRIY